MDYQSVSPRTSSLQQNPFEQQDLTIPSNCYERMTVFGIVADLPFIIGHCVMLGLLVILILLEYAVEYLDVKAEQYSITLLLEKLKKELMFMGIISFVVFIYGLITNPSEGDSIYSSFEMSHMICVFVSSIVFDELFNNDWTDIYHGITYQCQRSFTSIRWNECT